MLVWEISMIRALLVTLDRWSVQDAVLLRKDEVIAYELLRDIQDGCVRRNPDKGLVGNQRSAYGVCLANTAKVRFGEIDEMSTMEIVERASPPFQFLW